MNKYNSKNEISTEFKIPPRASLFGGAIVQWFSMGIYVLLGLIVTPIIIRTLGKESYGLWGLAASFVGFYGLFDFGLSVAVSRFLGNAIGTRDTKQLNEVASTGKCLLWGVSLLVVVFALLIMKPAQVILRIPEVYTVQFRLLLVLCAVSLTVSLIMSVYGAALLASEDFVVLSCIRVVANAIRSLGGLTLVLSGKGVVGLAVAAVVAGGLEQFAIYLRCRMRIPQLKAAFSGFRRPVAIALIGFSAATFVVMIAAVIRSKLDVMLVTRFRGLGQAGLYTVAITAFVYVANAIGAVFGVTWPRLNKLQGAGNLVELQKFFRQVSHITAAAAASLSGLAIGLAPLLIYLWLGDGYQESATVLQILVAGYFLDFATNPGIGSLYATARHKYFAVQTTVEGIASFTLAFILGAKYGMKGVAFGIVIPIILIKLTIQPWYVTRNLGIALHSYWFRVIGMTTLATGILATGLLPIDYCVTRWGWWTLPVIILSAMVVPGMILWMFVLDRSDRASLVLRFRHIYEVVYLRNQVGVFSALQSESKDAK